MTANVTAEKDRLPFLTKLIYGLGDWGNSSTSTIFAFFFSFFLTDIARLDPLYAAPVLLIGGIWDAVNDPLIGVFADRVSTRWGRRRPFFLLCAIPLSLTFIALWWVPPWDSQALKAIYFGLAYIAFDTFYTLLTVPYVALTPELTEDYNERTRLNGFRMSVSMAAGLISAVAVPLIVASFVQPKSGYFLMAIIFGGLASIPYFLLFFKIKERFAETAKSDLSVFRSFLLTFRNRAFRYAAGIYMTAWVSVSVVEALFQYYITYWMLAPDQLDIMLGMVQLSALICIPIMVLMSNRMGKTQAYLVGVGWWVVVMLVLGFLPQGTILPTYILAATAGLGIAAAHVVPWSIIPDVIDADELATGHRREGTYYGFLVFLQKTGTAFTLALVQWMLHFSGYVAGASQPASALFSIRMLIGPFPAVLLVISMFLAWRYPLSRSRHSAMRAELADRRGSDK
jgi:GPH family glycoside/pentoside/hexuronide:cation symporter